MNYKKLLISSLASLFLMACSSTETMKKSITPLPASEVCCDDFSQFPWIQLNNAEEINFQLDSDSPIGYFEDGNSYFTAFKLSARSQKVTLRLLSLMLNNTVVAPRLLALNQSFELVSSTNIEQLEIKTSSAFSRNQFQLDVELDASKTPYIIIYSSQAHLGQSIKVKHPARIRAEEFGEVMPMVTDPIYTYERFGKLQLSIKTLSLQAKKASTKQAKETVKLVQPETKKFFQMAITESVNNNDISKALSLIEEAKALGITDADKIFINALEKNK